MSVLGGARRRKYSCTSGVRGNPYDLEEPIGIGFVTDKYVIRYYIGPDGRNSYFIEWFPRTPYD